MRTMELINPIDIMTFKTPDLFIAASAVFMLGHGHMGAREINAKGQRVDGGLCVPIFPVTGHEGWLEDNFQMNAENFMHKAVHERTTELCECLESVIVGTMADREKFEEEAARCVDRQHYLEFAMAWNRHRRSSINDWARRAYELVHNIKVTVGVPK